MSLSEALQTTAFILCRSYHNETRQVTASEELASGTYTWRLEWTNRRDLSLGKVWLQRDPLN